MKTQNEVRVFNTVYMWAWRSTLALLIISAIYIILAGMAMVPESSLLLVATAVSVITLASVTIYGLRHGLVISRSKKQKDISEIKR